MKGLPSLAIWMLALVVAPIRGGTAPSNGLIGGGALAVSTLSVARLSEATRASSEPFLSEIEFLERQCLEQVNLQRKARGLSRLSLSGDLLQVARAYSRRMAEEKFFSHLDPEGRSVQQRVREARIRWTALGENLAMSAGYINPVAAAFNGWMGSSGHRNNILAPDYEQTAVGVWVSPSGAVYFTEIFLRQ